MTAAGRDRGLERSFLERAERAAATPPGQAFADHVQARLDAYGREHGDTFTDRPIADLLAEVAEEAADVAGWSALALTVLQDAELPDVDRVRVEAALESLAALGAQTFAIADRAIPAAEDQAGEGA